MRISDWSSDVCSSDLIVMAGDIGGAGVVQKIGSGTLTLTGNNSQVLIDVLGGRLIASSQGSVGADGGDIYLRQDSSFTAGSDMTLTQNVHVVGGNATFEIGRASCRERVCPYV